MHCPSSVVCRPSVRRPLDYLHFQLLLQNRLMDFDETWHAWSTLGPVQVLLFFGQIRPGADPGWGRNMSGVPFSKELLLQTGRRQQQNECISIMLHLRRSVAIICFMQKSIFDVFLDLVVLVYINAISIDIYAAMNFICINSVYGPCL